MHKHSYDNWLNKFQGNHIDQSNYQNSRRISKSKIKRDTEVLKDLGVELIALGKNMLSKVHLDAHLFTAIQLVQSMKKEDRRRQLKFITKMLRHSEPGSLKTIYNILHKYHNQRIAFFIN